MKRNNPSTSKDAFKSLRAEDLREVYKKIMDALKVLGSASTEQIAEYLTMEHAKIHKRVSEMEGMQLIYRPGGRVPTKSKRTAFVWTICDPSQPKVEKPSIKEERAMHEFANDLISKVNAVQTDLFGGKI
jgi:predicted transcriptional regulator